MENIEIWKDVVGFEGFYQVSDLGNIKSLERNVWNTRSNSYHNIKEKILKPSKNKHGYLNIVMSKNNTKYYFRINRLVAINFIPNSENKSSVNHKDGNKLNNQVQNLEWCTCKENTSHGLETGLINNKGENHINSKLTEIQVNEIISNDKLSQRKLASIYKVSQMTICQIKNKKSWKHI